MFQLSISTNRMVENPKDYVGLTLPNGYHLEDEDAVLDFANSTGMDENITFADEDKIPGAFDWVLNDDIFTVEDVVNNRVHNLSKVVPKEIQNRVSEGDWIRVIDPSDDNNWVFCVVTYVSRCYRMHTGGKTVFVPFQMGVMVVKTKEVNGESKFYL